MSDMTYIDPLPFAVLSYNCLTCNTKKAKYVCPKCSVPYCSSRCYKAHNLECTEDFYMENVIQNLKSKRVTREEAKKFNKILQNVNEIEITNQILTEEDEKRLEKMLETDAEDIRLTQDEHAKFLKDVKAGVLMKYIEEWVPWWIDVEPVNLDICDIESPICKAYLDLPSISALTSKPPSDQLINHITNLI